MRRRASEQTRGACGRAEHASTRGTQTRGVQARGARKHAGRADAWSNRPSGPAFLFSFGRARKFAGRCRGGGAPGIGPQGHKASTAPPRTLAKHLSHSRGGLKVSVAPGCVLSCSSFPKGARVSRIIRIANARTPNEFEGSETHTQKFQTPKYAASIGIKAARTILGGCPMNAVLSDERNSPREHLRSERSPMQATRTRSSRYLSRRWHRESESGQDSRALADECRYTRSP